MPVRGKIWTDSAADYVLDRARHVIERFGARDPGSEGERRTQEFVRDELIACADDVRIESFRVSPKALMGFLPVSGLLFLVGIFAYESFPSAANAACVLGVGIVALQFRRYWRVLDPFFPKRTSHNVYAVRRASGDCRQRIILGGHADAAYEWRYNLMGRGVLLGVIYWAIAGVCFVTILNFLHVLQPIAPWLSFPGWRILEWGRFAFVPVIILTAFYTRFSVVAPGANDNLTGTFAAVAVLRHLHAMNVRFAHTEVCCLVTGSEEAGLRGAKAFAAAHNRELKEIPTAFLALDTFHDTEHFMVYKGDLNGTVCNDAAFSALVREAGKDCGFDIPIGTIRIGATDAAAFTQAGITATALVAMDPAPPRFYHTRLDHWNNMDPECIRHSLAIALAAVERYDRASA